MHVTQARTQGAARDYLTHRLDTRPGQTPRMARRAHKRLLANVIIRRMWRDARTTTQPTTTTQTPQTATAA